VLLNNDAGLLEGTGTQARYVTIREPEDIREQELTALIAEPPRWQRQFSGR
jgi:hypothetical protein